MLLTLLPPANRDTLWALLRFLATVHRHSADSTDGKGREVRLTGMISPVDRILCYTCCYYYYHHHQICLLSLSLSLLILSLISVEGTLVYFLCFSVSLIFSIYISRKRKHKKMVMGKATGRAGLASAELSVARCQATRWTPITWPHCSAPTSYTAHAQSTRSSSWPSAQNRRSRVQRSSVWSRT